MYQKKDFIWWYMGVIKKGVLTEAVSIIGMTGVIKF